MRHHKHRYSPCSLRGPCYCSAVRAPRSPTITLPWPTGRQPWHLVGQLDHLAVKRHWHRRGGGCPAILPKPLATAWRLAAAPPLPCSAIHIPPAPPILPFSLVTRSSWTRILKSGLRGSAPRALGGRLSYSVPTNSFPGTNRLAGLVLKGGALNTGDDAHAYTILGTIQAFPGTLSYLNPNDTLNGSATSKRGFIIAAQLSGSGTLAVLNAQPVFRSSSWAPRTRSRANGSSRPAGCKARVMAPRTATTRSAPTWLAVMLWTRSGRHLTSSMPAPASSPALPCWTWAVAGQLRRDAPAHQRWPVAAQWKRGLHARRPSRGPR